MNFNLYKLFYNIVTISSAVAFYFLFVLNDFPESHIYIHYLIISSIIYKFIYLYYIRYSFILYIINQIDYICIFNLLWSHNYKYFLNYEFYVYVFILLLSILNCYAFHFCLVYLYFLTLLKLIIYDKILLFFYILSGLFISYSYYLFHKQGWNLINSWSWHLSICLCFLCVKMSYMN